MDIQLQIQFTYNLWKILNYLKNKGRYAKYKGTGKTKKPEGEYKHISGGITRALILHLLDGYQLPGVLYTY